MSPTAAAGSRSTVSLLRFQGDRMVGGTGRYQGATGRILSNREVPGGNDIVARLRLR